MYQNPPYEINVTFTCYVVNNFQLLQAHSYLMLILPDQFTGTSFRCLDAQIYAGEDYVFEVETTIASPHPKDWALEVIFSDDDPEDGVD